MDSSEEAVYSPDGPLAVAWRFVESIHRLDFGSAWELLDDDFRLADAQFWARDNGRPWTDAETVAATGPGGPLWRTYIVEHFERYVEILEWVVDLLDRGRLGTVAQHRPIGLDLEDVIFSDAPESREFEANESFVAYRFLMRKREGWAVAGFAGDVPVPGHPPRIERYDENGFSARE